MGRFSRRTCRGRMGGNHSYNTQHEPIGSTANQNTALPTCCSLQYFTALLLWFRSVRTNLYDQARLGEPAFSGICDYLRQLSCMVLVVTSLSSLATGSFLVYVANIWRFFRCN